MAGDRSSGGFGGKLRDARERRGVSLRQIANATKISIGALEALERNDISRLPGGIFSRAFVRSYAVEVGLDPDATIQEFIAQFPNDSVTAGHPAGQDVEDGVSVDSDRRMAGTFLWLIGLSLPIAGGLLYFATAGRSVDHQPESEPAAATAVAPDAKPVDAPPAAATRVPAPAAETPARPAAAPPAPPPSQIRPPTGAAPPPTAPPSAAAAATPPAATPATDGFTVSLSVRRPCWVSATVDGAKAIERLLQPGERQTIAVKREMVLTAGDASALALALNGVPARALGRAGEVVTARFNLNNFKDYVQSR
jgi:cytoskeletal protein RodZ